MPHFEILHDNSFSRWRRAVAVITVVSVALTSGCYPSVNEYDARVTGTVIVGGELATSGLVTFHPVSGGRAAFGHIHKDGSYSLRTGQGKLGEGDGGTVSSGEYVVAVTVSLPATRIESMPVDEAQGSGSEDESGDVPDLVAARASAGGPPPSGPTLSAEKYRSKATSDLRRTVKPGNNVFVLELERATVEEIAEETVEETVPEEPVAEETEVASESSEESVGETEEAAEPAEEAANPSAAEVSP